MQLLFAKQWSVFFFSVVTNVFNIMKGAKNKSWQLLLIWPTESLRCSAVHHRTSRYYSFSEWQKLFSTFISPFRDISVRVINTLKESWQDMGHIHKMDSIPRSYCILLQLKEGRYLYVGKFYSFWPSLWSPYRAIACSQNAAPHVRDCCFGWNRLQVFLLLFPNPK